MSRRMSCSMTVDGVRNRTKTVTRRHIATWKEIKPGDRLTLIEKGMGLKKGERQVVLAEVEVTDVRIELVDDITPDDITREAVPLSAWMNYPAEWADWWKEAHGYNPHDYDTDGWYAIRCRRIEWRYLP